MKVKLEIFKNKEISGNDVPVLRLESEDEKEKEILAKIFASEKLVPVAQGDYPNFQHQSIVENRIVSLILE